MSNPIKQTLSALVERRSAALIPFITAGYPDSSHFGRLADSVVESGADLLEIGFPHSDPIADGPVIQRSSQKALAGGFTLDKGFEYIAAIRKKHDLPIIIMTYTNLVMRQGVDTFIKKCLDTGVNGLIVPDMIIEESADMRELCSKHGLSFINLIAPTTPPERARQIGDTSTGFVYLVSTAGTTGKQTRTYDHLQPLVSAVRNGSDLPVAVGFGISSPEAAANAAKIADGVIIGSKILDIAETDSPADNFPNVRAFTTDIKQTLEVTK